MTTPQDNNLRMTPLDSLHRKLKAKMVPFTGYSMPVQYKNGIIAEHNHTRYQAGLFDVSHMGQAVLRGENAAKALERLVPGDLVDLPIGHLRYTMLTNDKGGILDDMMVTNLGDHLFLVVNASRKKEDFARIREHLDGQCELEILEHQALLALQGPKASAVLSRLAKAAKHMMFMSAETLKLGGVHCLVSRSGYTGEDGFEISVPADEAENLALNLLDEAETEPVGLGARDSLRLEAGLCLYGNDIDETTTPIEAGLAWTISKRRRSKGTFPGATVIREQLASGPPKKRVGIKPDGKAPARAHTEIQNDRGQTIGEITSGGYGPSVDGPVAMGYVETEYAKPDTPIILIVRGKPMSAKVIKLPFAPHRYHKSE